MTLGIGVVIALRNGIEGQLLDILHAMLHLERGEVWSGLGAASLTHEPIAKALRNKRFGDATLLLVRMVDRHLFDIFDIILTQRQAPELLLIALETGLNLARLLPNDPGKL